MKKTIIGITAGIILSALIWFGGTCMTFGRFQLWDCILPVYIVIIGICSGIRIKRYWILPLIQPLFFLADCLLLGERFWGEPDFGSEYALEKAWVILTGMLPVGCIEYLTSDILLKYMLFYLLLAVAAMLLSALITRLLHRNKAADIASRSDAAQ